ncbi:MULTISPECIES: hypothetical protein [unclassified Streptomyces]|uniref:hypothetical protein n=1 Tax=unclassified Streptomyces TaxID=2593676 RepID=UPI0036F66D1E
MSAGTDTGRPAGLRMVPLRARRMRLEAAAEDERAWLRETLDRVSDADIALDAAGALTVTPPSGSR